MNMGTDISSREDEGNDDITLVLFDQNLLTS